MAKNVRVVAPFEIRRIVNDGIDSEYSTLAAVKGALDEMDRGTAPKYYGFNTKTGRKFYSFKFSGPKSNPIKSTRISGRKGLSQTAYVNRPSQDPEHKAPSKRLKTRRKKALKAPEGYFPNPVEDKIYRGIPFMKLPKLKPGYAWLDVSEIGEKPAWKMIVSPHPEGGKKLFGYDEAEFMAKQYRKKNPLKPGIEKHSSRHYHVEYSGHENGPWKLAGAFPTVGAARDYAKALAAKNPKIWFRVAD